MIKTITSHLKSLKFWSVFTAYIETICLCHVPNSFQILEYALRENNFFNETSSERQAQIYSNLYMVIQNTMLFFSLLAGFITDSKGTWWSRHIAQILMVIGIISAMLITKEKQWLIWIAYPLFYAGGGVNSEMNMLCYILYPTKMGMLSSLTGLSVAAAQAWYLYYKKNCIPFENLKTFWGIMLAMMPMMAIRTFLVMPKLKVTKEIDRLGWKTRNDSYATFGENQSNPKVPVTKSPGPVEAAEEPTLTDNLLVKRQKSQDSKASKITSTVTSSSDAGYSPTLFSEITKPHVLALFAWCLISDFRVILYYSKFQPWLRYKIGELDDLSIYNHTQTLASTFSTDQPAEESNTNPQQLLISKYTEVFNYCLMSQMFADPLCGFFIDLANKLYRHRLGFNLNQATVLTSSSGLILCTVLLTAISFLQIQNFSGKFVILAGVCAAFIDSIRFSCKFMMIFTVIDYRVVPRVMGFGSFLIIMVNLLVILVNKFVLSSHGGDWDVVFEMLGYLTIASVVFPCYIIYIYFYGRGRTLAPGGK